MRWVAEAGLGAVGKLDREWLHQLLTVCVCKEGGGVVSLNALRAAVMVVVMWQWWWRDDA